MSTRLRVTVVGRIAEHQLIKVTLDADPATVRAELITKASAKLGVSVLDRERVRMFLAGGAVLDDVTMLEKDDTVYFAFAGGPWHAPRGEESDSDSFVEQEFDPEEEAAWLERSRAIQRYMIAPPAPPSREECAAAMAAQRAASAASRSPAEKDATRRLVVDLMVQRAQGNNMDRHGEPACSNPSRSSSTHLGIDLTPCLTLSLSFPPTGNVIDAQDLAQNTAAFMAMMDDDFKEEVKARLAA